MRIAILQHEPNEWIGSMQDWFEEKNYALNTTLIYQGEALPDIEAFDWLLIMGGGMSVYDEANYPWLIEEKKLIRQAIQTDKKVLGICLGGQLIASALGANVYANEQQEIGWHSVVKTAPEVSWCPNQFTPLSWHGDRFDLPEGAVGFAESVITPHQGFFMSAKVWALQFHLEANQNSVNDFYAVTGELPEGEYVQTLADMLEKQCVEESKQIMHALLNVIDLAE